MKIGIEAQRIFRPKKHGMDIYALELIKALQQIDKQNEYVVFVKPDVDVCLSETENFKIVEVSGKTYLDWEQISLPNAIAREQVDLMHFTSNTAPINVACPYVLTLHDIIYLEKTFSKGSFYQMAGHFYRKWNVPQVARKAKFVLTVSEYEKVQIQNTLSITNSNIKAIYNAYNQQFRLIEDLQALKTIKEKYNLPERFIFFLGNQAPKKNMKNVLQAYSKYIDTSPNAINLVIAESSVKDIVKLLKEIGCEDILPKIILTGYLPHTELPHIYNLATLFLYPSLRESFGIPIIEAMACGTPVITSNTSAMPEVAGNAAVLVNPTNVEAISQAIEKVLSSEKLYKHLKYSGLSRALDFSWQKTAEETLKIYQTL